MKNYVPTIGLEIHAQLNTETKMFCNSANDPDETRPNVNVCPVCMGHPGTLPTINKEAVRQVLRVGQAVGGELADYTEFDRKNYFYPDLPKGYQISQYEHPLVRGGELLGVEITRIHLEEDTGTNIHKDGESLVNYNRAGVPLLELVTEAVIDSAEKAEKFGRELQLLLQTLSASEANLEKGEMRVEANISVREKSKVKSRKLKDKSQKSKEESVLGTKVEVKNLNSFAALREAISYERKRQKEVLARGEEVRQETRGWDEEKQKTFPQRVKEEADDYRYFPDPDLPKLVISKVPEFSEEELAKSLPELPRETRNRLDNLGISEEDIETLLARRDLKELFDVTAKELPENQEEITLLVNYLTSDVIGLEREHDQRQDLEPDMLAKLIKMIADDELSSRGGKDVLAILFTEGGEPEKIARENELMQQSGEEELIPVVEEIIAENSDVVEEYLGGKSSAIQYLIGQGMQKTGGSANPEVLKELLKKKMQED